eukprot:s11580_g1.t1
MIRVEKLPRYLKQRVEMLPQLDPGCAGSFQDLNEHRISVPITQALQSGLAEVEAATTDTAHALMQTFLWSRKGPNEEDLMERLSFPSDEGEGYAAFIRFGPKHVYLRALCEVEVDPAGSAKRGKKTNQLIYEYDSVRISAFHLQIATKSELKQGEYLREWAGTLEVPLSAALEAFEALGLSLGLNIGDSQPSTSSQPGGVTPHGYQGGDAPPTSGSVTLAPVDSAPDPDMISEWMGEPGSLGKYTRDAQDPESRFFVSISKALAGCLRHGHYPPVTATSASRKPWQDVYDMDIILQ